MSDYLCQVLDQLSRQAALVRGEAIPEAQDSRQDADKLAEENAGGLRRADDPFEFRREVDRLLRESRLTSDAKTPFFQVCVHTADTLEDAEGLIRERVKLVESVEWPSPPPRQPLTEEEITESAKQLAKVLMG